MATGRENSLAKQIGEYMVCAELGRRGIIATPFAGNVPTFDILAADEQCRAIPIQVKASKADNWPSTATNWMKLTFDAVSKRQIYSGPTQLIHPELIYIYVAISSGREADRFFILEKSDVQNVYLTITPLGWKKRIGGVLINRTHLIVDRKHTSLGHLKINGIWFLNDCNKPLQLWTSISC